MMIMVIMMAQHISGANFEYNTPKIGSSPDVSMYEVPTTKGVDLYVFFFIGFYTHISEIHTIPRD